MSLKSEFEQNLISTRDQRIAEQDTRPVMEFLPDDFDLWVASHDDRVRAVVCSTPEFESSPFCGSGIH
ncbi:MAG: hypothetical protein FJ118_12645 [Deltaproteobacteria bacterium]|nr:hypothetical protein [Deltaproteobacteria bacterium]